MLDTVISNLAVNSVFSTIRSRRDTNKCHLFSFFRNSVLCLITVFFTMVIKRSPGGKSAGGGRSTSKSTCVVLAWTLTSENASFALCASRWSHQLTSDPKSCLLFWKYLQCRVMSESSFGAYVCHRRPEGLHRHQRLLYVCFSFFFPSKKSQKKQQFGHTSLVRTWPL